MKVKEGQVLARLDDTNVKSQPGRGAGAVGIGPGGAGGNRAATQTGGPGVSTLPPNWPNNTSRRNPIWTRPSRTPYRCEAHLAQQKLDVVVAERNVALWQQQMDDMIIRAPFDGVVTTKDAQPGEMISPVSAGGGFTRTGIGTIVDMDSLEIEIDVNESYINRVEPGQPVEATLDAYPDWKIPCKVIAIIPTADRQKSTVKVRVGFDQLDPRILPDMSVKVAFPRQRRRADGEPHGARSQKRGAATGTDTMWCSSSSTATPNAAP